MHRLLIIIILFSKAFTGTYAQSNADVYSQLINLSRNNDFKEIYTSVDSLSKLPQSKMEYCGLQINRMIDLNFVHKRIKLFSVPYSFQMDFLIRNDTILFSAVKDIRKNQSHFEFDTSAITNFVDQRNELYGSNKSIHDLKKELLISESFAMYCGDGSPLTDKGRQIISMADDEEVDEFRTMTRSFSPEIQAYGVAGLERLKRKDFELSAYDSWVIDYIRKRNAEVISCSGCFDGIVRKIYSK
jgi:hypothetical protein